MIWKHLLDQKTPESAGRIAVHTGDDQLSYAELRARAVRISSRLPLVGQRPQRVLLTPGTPLSLLLRVLACWYRGFAPMIQRESMSARLVAELSENLQPVATLSEDPTDHLPVSHPPSPIRPAEFSARDEALIIATSGTTGTPKAVALPAESVCLNAATIASALELTPEDCLAVTTPLGYAYGLIGGCLTGLWAGASLQLSASRDSITPLTQLQATIRRVGITVLQGPPSLFRLFLAYWSGDPFPSIRILTTGGEPLDAELKADLQRVFPRARMAFLYGMTEAGPRISHQSFTSGGGINNAIGDPFPHFEWRLDPVPELSLPAGSGRLVLGGASMFLGYIGAAGAYYGLDENGYFASSDLLSRDDQGQLHFCGRLDRSFRSGGKLVHPDAIERILRAHPGVNEVRCFAVTHSVLGLVPQAEIVPKSGHGLNPSDLLAYCREHMENHLVPRHFALLQTFPLSESGKRQPAPSPHP